MSSLTDLRGVVDVVIGGDTHVHSHDVAAVETGTGGVLGEITVEATAEGHAQPVAFADEPSRLRAWAIGGTGGHETGLTHYLAGGEELVVELDRPMRRTVGPTGAAQSQASRGHPLKPETDRAPSAQERSTTRPGRAIRGATRGITVANCD